MSSEFDFEINSSDSETDDFDFEDNKKELEICVLLNVHGTVKAIVDTIDCIQKNNTKCILYILDNGSHEIYRKYIEDNILKQNYGCVSVKYHFEKTPINVDEMFQKGMDLIVNDNVEKIIFSHNYEFSNNAKEIINQHPILFQNTFRINVLFKIENTRSETKNVKSLPLDKKPLNKPPKKNFVQRLKERKINRNVDSQTFYENKNKFRHMIKKQGKKENKKKENKIGVIACTNKCKFLFNIVNNYYQQTYYNKKLFVVLNNESIDKNILVHLLDKRNADYEILHVNSKHKLGYCLNQAISKCREQGIKYCSKFDDDDIYLPEYLTEQVNALDTQDAILVGKSVCMLYKPYTNECRLIDHGICNSVENSYTNFVWGATLTFDIQRLKKFGISFNESVHSGSDSIFNRDVSKYGKTYATTRNNYYCLRYDDGSHTWGDIGLNLEDYKKCEAPDFCLETTEYLNELNRRNIFQCYTSNDLKHLEDRMVAKYNVTNKNIDTNKPVVVFGLYYDQDYDFLKNHAGDKYVIFGGSDIDMAKYQSKIREIQKYNKIHFLSISKNIQTRLYKKSIYSDLIKLDLVNRTIFKPLAKKGDHIFVYDGRLWQRNDDTYGKSIFTKVMKRLPQYKFIFSSQLNVDNTKMIDIYTKCFIGLRLTPRDGNANMVQEMEAMGIPVVHNHSDYGLKWKTVDDVVNLIRKEFVYNNNKMNEKKYNFYELQEINNDDLRHIDKNLDMFKNNIKKYNKILFICSDYPGYGGAATNCNRLVNFFEENHTVHAVYHTDDIPEQLDLSKRDIFVKHCNLEKTLRNMNFQPDLIILKNTVHFNLRNIFPRSFIYYLIPGIYRNHLDKYYLTLSGIHEHEKYINKSVINQIISSDLSFCNSSHTQDILKKLYNLDTLIFYSTFVSYYGKNIDTVDISDRKYDYGLIVSDFSRKIKNIEDSISFLKDKDNVILIGKGSSKYKKHGFECVELVKSDEMKKYYQQIKYIVQDSFFESCSNVKIEGIMNGCQCYRHVYMLNLLKSISKKKKTIIFISFTKWTSGILRGYNIANNPLLQQNFNIEYFMLDSKNKKLLKYINNSIIIFIKGNLRTLSGIKKMFGKNNYFIHDIIDTYGDRGDIKDIKRYEKCFDLLLVNSKYMKTIFINNGISDNKIKVLYHPCDQKLKIVNTIENKVNYIGNVDKCSINLKSYDISCKKFTHCMNRSIHFTYVENSNIFFSFHTSTKLATCIKLKSILICNKIPVMVELLGNDYPFFVDNTESIKSLIVIAKKLLTNSDKYMIFYNKYYKSLELLLLDNTYIYKDLFDSINISQYNSNVCFKVYLIDEEYIDNFDIKHDMVLEDYDYYIYTNSNKSFLDFLPYKKIYCDIKTKKHCFLFSRYIKWGPHLLFDTYSYSIYMDCYFNLIKKNKNKYNNIIQLLTENNNVIVDKHKCRKNIIEEINYLIHIYHHNSSHIIKENPDKLTNLLRLIDNLDNKNEISNRELSQNGVIFTLIQNNEKANCIFNMLTHLFNEYTHRDQCCLQIAMSPRIYPKLQTLFSISQYPEFSVE